MDVRLPDGRIIRNVPDGVTQDELAQQVRLMDSMAAQRAADAAEYAPTGTGAQNFAAGAGKAVVDIGRGVRQLGAEAGNLVGLVGDDTVARLRAEEDERAQRDAALMQTGAGQLGYVGGTVATMALPLGMVGKGAQAAGAGRTAQALTALANPSTYRAAAASGAVLGAAQPVGADDSRALNTVIGAGTGVAGQAIGAAARRVAQPVRSALGRTQQWAVSVLERNGIPLDLGQKTGSAFVQRVRRAVQDNPVTAGQVQEFRQTQQRAFNRAVLRLVGENAEEATPQVMAAAKARIGSVFDRFAQQNGVRVDNQLLGKLSTVFSGAQRELETPQFAVVAAQIDEVMNKAAANGGTLDGAAYQNIKTVLDRLSGGVDQSKGFWIRELRDSLDDALQRSAPPSEVQLLKFARAQYRRLKQIEAAVANNEAGDISAAKLFNALNVKSNRAQSIYGKGDQELVRLARAGKLILPSKLADSGTPAGLLAQAALPLGAGLTVQAATGDIESAAKTAAAVYALPKLATAAMTRPGAVNYLAGGLQPGVVRNALLGSGAARLPQVAPAIAYAQQQ
jgi:hypothetical protein